MSTHRTAVDRHDETPALAPRVPAEPARRFGHRRSGSPDGLWYRTVARYRTFVEARRAADHLREQGFPEPSVTIVGRDLEGLDQATRRLVGWRAAGRTALAATAVGALVGWLVSIVGGTGASVGYLVFAGAGIGAMLGAVAGYARHLVATYRRDLTSIGGVTAASYQVQVDRRHAHAERVLARYWPT